MYKLWARILLTAMVMAANSLSAQTKVETPAPEANPTDVSAPKDPATEDQIREYLSLIRTDKLAHEMMDQMAKSMQATSAPYFPASFWDDIRTEFRKFDLLSPHVTVYQHYLSRTDMQAVIDFYRSAAGQKLLTAQPLAIRDVQVMVKETAEKIGMAVYERHKAEIEAAKAKFEADAAANAAATQKKFK